MQVLDDLYVYLWESTTENNCNSVVVDGKVPVLIDPGHLHRVDNLKDRMSADGFDPARIKVIIVTHAHPDHFEGTLAFKKPSVKIAVSRLEERFMEDVGRSMYVAQGLTMPDYRVDFFLQEGNLILGKHQFEVLLTPGHSPGSLCIYWPRHKVLIAGDVVFVQGVGRTDLPGGDAAALKRSVERLSKLPVELFIPGHGPELQGEDDIRANFRFVAGVLM